MSLDQEVLVQLRDQAIATALPLIEDQVLAPEKRFSMLMTVIESNPSADLIRKALEVTQSIEDPSIRADALMDIVDEIDLLIEVAGIEVDVPQSLDSE